jgi:hypothetical protein
MSKIDEDAVPVNATGSAVSGTSTSDPTLPLAKKLGSKKKLLSRQIIDSVRSRKNSR